MTAVARLVTYVDLDARDATSFSVSARLEAVLADGRAVVLLDDRGWSSSGPAGLRISVEDIERDARTVVGPDEPGEGMTQEEMAAGHWACLAGILRRQGVEVDSHELQQLPLEVVLSERLQAAVR